MTTFRERRVEADGFDIRYVEAGAGPALVCFHGGGGLRLSRAHDLLAERHHVIAFELPGFGASPVNDRSQSLRELAGTMSEAIAQLGIDRCSLWGTSFGGKLALWLAADDPGPVEALVLAAPAAIRPEGARLPSPAELAAMLYAHPERQPPATPPQPEVAAKQSALVQRLLGPPRDPELEDQMRRLEVSALVLIGSEDRITPPELGRHYCELLPSCHFVIVYDAAHAIDGDRPEAFTAVVNDFLEHQEQFIVRRESALLYP